MTASKAILKLSDLIHEKGDLQIRDLCGGVLDDIIYTEGQDGDLYFLFI